MQHRVQPIVQGVARPTVFVESRALSDRLACDVTLALESFQFTGSFKFRAAYNVAASVPNQRILAASSGNFGQALAYACHLLGKRCTIVMPTTSAAVKVDAVRRYGGEVALTDTTVISRAERVAQLAHNQPDSYVASAYDDPLVIEGNSTLGMEIGTRKPCFDLVVAPVGGGGLAAGVLAGLLSVGARARLIGAEPLLGNDAARSLRERRIVTNETEPQTIADGARTLSLGLHNWSALQHGFETIVEVPEEDIVRAVRMLFLESNVKAEPTGALSLGAVLTDRARFRGASVCCIVSGGNVDPGVYANLIAS